MRKNKPYSWDISMGDDLPASQAMLYALGLTDEDLNRPFIGIGSTGFEGNPCNMHLNDLAELVKQGVREAGLTGLVFNTIGISDGIAMGTPGMRHSLPSREIIADSMESVVDGMGYDGLVAVVGCDKNMPGALMAMLRLNRPSILVYGGTIASGNLDGNPLNIISAFEAWGEKISGKMSDAQYRDIIRHACPGPGACGGMYTANNIWNRAPENPYVKFFDGVIADRPDSVAFITTNYDPLIEFSILGIGKHNVGSLTGNTWKSGHFLDGIWDLGIELLYQLLG